MLLVSATGLGFREGVSYALSKKGVRLTELKGRM